MVCPSMGPSSLRRAAQHRGGGWLRLGASLCVVLEVSVASGQSVKSFPPADQAAAPSQLEGALQSREPIIPPSPPASAPTPATGYGSTPAAPAPLAPESSAFYPPSLPYREGQPVPTGYRLDEQPQNGLVFGGLLTLGVGYVAGLAVGAGEDFEGGAGWLVLPVIGPWAAIGAREIHCDSSPEKARECIDLALSEAQLVTFLTVDGLVQAVGLVLMGVGLFNRQRELVRNDLAGVTLRGRRTGGGYTLSVGSHF
jgi:hypothetical protein